MSVPQTKAELTKEKKQMITIRKILSSPSENTEWLYLPPDHDSWTLDTEGAFSLNASDFSPDSNEYLPKEVMENDAFLEF